MPTFSRFDHDARIVVLGAQGEIAREEALARMRAMFCEMATLYASDPENRYGVLVDTRRAATVPTPGDIAAMLDEMARHRVLFPACRWAVLATEPAHYGMGRLLSAHAEGRGIDVRVFSTQESAVAWLRGGQ